MSLGVKLPKLTKMLKLKKESKIGNKLETP